jgi:hypothetical protein
MHTQSIILVLLTIHIQRREYFVYFNILKYADLYNLPFYTINKIVVSLFANLSILILEIINLLYQFTLSNFGSVRMNQILFITLFCKKKF